MGEAAAPSVVRLKIPCADQREFVERFAKRYAQSGVFVTGGQLRPVGSRLTLKLEFRDGTVGVSGDALVTAQGTRERPGMVLRFTALHPGSIQFELSPVGGAGPAPARPAEAPVKAELAEELFGPDALQDEPSGSARPLEVRTGKVKLKLKGTVPPPLPTRAGSSPASAGPRRRGRRFGVAVTVLGLGVLAAVGLAVAGALTSRHSKERLEAEIRTADARMLQGRLSRPSGDSALDHLILAREISTGDARVKRRLESLADTFEQLGARAAFRGDLREAAIHLEAAVRADPGRAGAARKLEEVRARLAGGAPAAGRP